MLKIYFDDTLINDDLYTDLSTTYTLFEKSFYLGSTASNSFSITIIKEAALLTPEEVKVYDGNDLIATLQVDNIEENDDGTTTYTLIDKMVDLDGFNYNAEDLIERVGTPTAYQVLEDICDQAGITLASNSFINDDIIITWYDNRISARDYVSYIAEIAGGYARINKDGELEIVPFNNTSSETINITDTSGYKIGEHYKITKVVFDNEAGIHFEAGNDTGNTLYLNQNNVYITTQEIVNNIYNSIKDFEFYNITIDDCEIDISNQVGSIITFTDGTNNYPTIVGRNLNYNGTWLGGYSLQLETEKQSETNISGSSDFYKNVEGRLNRDENMIEFLAEQIQETSNEITGANQLNYTNAAKGSVYQLRISGNGSLPIVRIPNDPLEPVANKFKVKAKYYLQVIFNNEIVQELDLPFDTLRFMNSNVKDTFEIENDIGTYTKKVGVDYNGEYYELATPIVITYENMGIESPGGDFIIKFNSDQGLSLYSKYLLKNDYTDVFATKVELKTGLQVTSNEVKLYVDGEIDDVEEDVREVQGELSLKLGKSEYGTLISMLNAAADEITLAGGSKINLTTAGKLLITAGNFQLDADGNITASNATLTGATINGGDINLQGTRSNPKMVFTSQDGKSVSKYYPNGFNVDYNQRQNVWTYVNDYSAGILIADADGFNCQNDISSNQIIITNYNVGPPYTERVELHPDWISVAGPCYATNISSDKRKKKDIKETKVKAIENIEKIKLKEFNWKDTDQHTSIGFIAQDLEKISKEYVLIDPRGNYYINELPLIATLTKAIQEQQEQINDLKKEIDKLKGGK